MRTGKLLDQTVISKMEHSETKGQNTNVENIVKSSVVHVIGNLVRQERGGRNNIWRDSGWNFSSSDERHKATNSGILKYCQQNKNKTEKSIPRPVIVKQRQRNYLKRSWRLNNQTKKTLLSKNLQSQRSFLNQNNGSQKTMKRHLQCSELNI